MKRKGNLLEEIASLDNLYLAFWKASRGKRYKESVLCYQKELDKNLALLQTEILTSKVKVGDYHIFKIYDPKEREICASNIKEQVLHHALMNVCHALFERVQVHDSYASRKGKGTHAALERAKEYTKKYTYFLKLDVQKFFASLPHSVMRRQIRNIIKDKSVIEIFDRIIDSYHASDGRGVPIGNLTSQYMANHFLSGLDHYIKEKLKIKAYVRYMDDMVLWHNDKEVLKMAKKYIENYLFNELGCLLKPSLLNFCTRALPFLGYKLSPYKTGLTQRSKLRFLKKMADAELNFKLGNWSDSESQLRVRPLLAFVRHTDMHIHKIGFEYN